MPVRDYFKESILKLNLLYRVCRYEWCWLCGSTYTSLHFTNPFGCMGLQSEENESKKWRYWKLILYRIGIILLMIMAAPFIVVLAFPVAFIIMINDNSRVRKIWRRLCLLATLLHIILFIIGLILNVIVIPVAIIALPFVLIHILVKYCKERRQLMQRHKETMLNRRLLGQDFNPNNWIGFVKSKKQYNFFNFCA